MIPLCILTQCFCEICFNIVVLFKPVALKLPLPFHIWNKIPPIKLIDNTNIALYAFLVLC